MSKDAYNKPYVKKAVLEDILLLRHSLRAEDVDEVKARDMTPEQGLCASFAESTVAYTVFNKDSYPIAMFGLTPTALKDVGCPWMLCGKEFNKVGKSCLRRCMSYIKEMYASHAVLTNLVDVRNYKAIRWLRWCGFEITGAHTLVGQDKIPFVTFIGRRQ